MDEESSLVQGHCEQDGAGGRKATSRCVKSLGTRSWNGETEVRGEVWEGVLRLQTDIYQM